MYFKTMNRAVFPSVLLIFILLFSLLSNIASVEARSNAGPRLKSRVAIVVDQTNGEIIYEKNASDVAPIASVTKLMTAMVIICLLYTSDAADE